MFSSCIVWEIIRYGTGIIIIPIISACQLADVWCLFSYPVPFGSILICRLARRLQASSTPICNVVNSLSVWSSSYLVTSVHNSLSKSRTASCEWVQISSDHNWQDVIDVVVSLISELASENSETDFCLSSFWTPTALFYFIQYLNISIFSRNFY